MYNRISDIDYNKLYHLKNLELLAIDFNPKLDFLIAEMRKKIPYLNAIVISSNGLNTEEQMQFINNGEMPSTRPSIHSNVSMPLSY